MLPGTNGSHRSQVESLVPLYTRESVSLSLYTHESVSPSI